MKSSFDIPQTIRPPQLSKIECQAYFSRIQELLCAQDAVLIAHYYTDENIQYLAEITGGFVGDSLEMAKFGQSHAASTLVVAGVRFMGESAKILSPHKRVLMPTLQADCSLDLGCPADQFAQFCAAHPERKVVVYANTSAAVKALADWVVTSSNALAIVNHLVDAGHKILWAPDRYLGSYIAQQTQADMVLWQGACVVHEEFKAEGIRQLKQLYPEAAILAHPESPAAVLTMADVVGSTSKLLAASRELPQQTFIVATDRGIFYKMRQASPHKTFLEAPTAGQGATCRCCAHCPWMAMNQLANLEESLQKEINVIKLDADLMAKARIPLQRMIEFKI